LSPIHQVSLAAGVASLPRSRDGAPEAGNDLDQFLLRDRLFRPGHIPEFVWQTGGERQARVDGKGLSP
jgi:hypothetical protein